MHAPFAQARTFLSEHGFGETKIVLHAEDGAVVVVKAKGERETQNKRYLPTNLRLSCVDYV